jgi:gamma-tubulin complex component 2
LSLNTSIFIFLVLVLQFAFFVLQGDFLVHFMDIAREELTKKPEEISVEKLQSLVDIALRSTAAASDPSHEDLTCCVVNISSMSRQTVLCFVNQ